jgi:hypothetical protein
MGAQPVTDNIGAGVPWSELRHALDNSDESPWPAWLPPRGPGSVTAIGHEAVTADHLGPTPCMSLKAWDIVSIAINDDFTLITYALIAAIQSRPDERLITFDYGGAPHEGWPDTVRAPMMRLFSSVYRRLPG